MDEIMTQSPAAEAPAAPKKVWKKKAIPGKKRRWPKALLALAVVTALAAWVVLPRLGRGNAQPQAAYLVETAQRRDLSVTVTGTATLEPADSYQVTTLLSGTLLTAPFEQDGLVEKDAVLYTLDSSTARESVDRAALSVEQARLSVQQAKEALNPTATLTGTLSEVYVRDGDNVAPGTALAKIVASTDLTIDFLFPYASTGAFYAGQPATVFIGNFDGSVQGTVVSVSDSATVTANGMQACTVRVKLANPGIVSDSFTASAVIGSYSSYGKAAISMAASATVYASGSGTVTGFTKLAGSTVAKGDVLCTVESQANRSQLETARMSLESAQLTVSSASGSLEDYTIKAPIAGTVIEKNFKAGDKVDGVSSGTLAVIYDLSCLKMEMDVNELDIGKVQPGQTVEVTAAALPGEVFTGTVERVSINGTTTSGFTTYPVTITIRDFGDLKPGMNVSAAICCETAADVVSVPVGAVSRGNVVLVPGEGALTEDGANLADPARLEERQVVLGRSDGDYIEITSGLSEGDTVVYQAADAGMGD